MATPPIHVTDHAIVRYMERVYGIDIERIRAELASPTAALADRIGAPFVILKSGHRAAVRDGCVQTVLPKRMGKKPR
jgi:CRISPR/Cas system-associated endonuclease Cas3-HD